MPDEPKIKRAVAFFDGQNLYHHAKAAFGHHHPNYDPRKLTQSVCDACQFYLHGVRFYTGVPTQARDPMWHAYWSNRLLAMRRSGILVTSRPLHYNPIDVAAEDGTTETIFAPSEKGIDIRLSLDLVRMMLARQLEVAIIFSQDQDLAEVVKEVKEIAKDQGRWFKVVCAFPAGPGASAKRGIDGAEWHRIEQERYESCLDMRDYRPKH